KALSKEQKRRQVINSTEKWMKRAMDAYKQNQDQQKSKRKSMQTVCKDMEKRCWEEDQVQITLSKSSLDRRLKGIPSQAQSNRERKSWLTAIEEQELINYALACADRGFPFSLKRLEEH
ncbi:hypothetical protein FA15DRAFT_548566, partial [Coprinopsis marcescibilis]